MLKIFLLVLTLLSHGHSFAIPTPTKQELKKLFREKENDLSGLSWTTNNDDSAFFKKDTISLYYRFSSCNDKPHYCEEIAWRFSKGRALKIINRQLCEGIPKSTIVFSEFWFTLKIKKQGNRIKLYVINSMNKGYAFEVISLDKCQRDFMAFGNFGYALKLKRLKMEMIKP